MPTSVRLIRRYVWLIDTIRRAKQITLDEINNKWMNEYSLRLEHEGPIPERTFHRHRQAISQIFDIDIKCRHNNGNTYYIANEDSLARPTFSSWLFNGLAIDNQLIGKTEIVNRIIFEDAPGGMDYMPIVIQALSERKKLKITYLSISHGQFTDETIEPYFIRERLRRWYIIGRIDGQSDINVFAFDRIENIELTEATFEFPKDINPATYFDEVVGILLDDEYDCERVVVRIFNRQAKYVALLPLHKTQKEVGRGKGYVDFEYHVRPEWEFVHEILRLGFEAEILSPQWLRDELKWQAEQIVKRY